MPATLLRQTSRIARASAAVLTGMGDKRALARAMQYSGSVRASPLVLLFLMSHSFLVEAQTRDPATDSKAAVSDKSNVAAQPQPEEATLYRLDHNATPRRRWYGWQTLTTDGLALGLTVATAALSDGNEFPVPLAVLALGTYVLGGPLVHFTHRHDGKGLLSLILRVGLPALTGGGLILATNCNPNECLGGGLLLIGGGVLGITAASAIDAAAIAREDVPNELALTPIVRIASDAASVGIAGKF
jgi:hypothetical protein